MAEFKPGDIVRSIIHQNGAALFVLVVEEYCSPIPNFFSGAVLINLTRSDTTNLPGTLNNDWPCSRFELSSWEELLAIAAILNK